MERSVISFLLGTQIALSTHVFAYLQKHEHQRGHLQQEFKLSLTLSDF